MRALVLVAVTVVACGDQAPPAEWPDEPARSRDPQPNAEQGSLTEKLIALWRPDDPASVPPSAYAAFDQELLRSSVYVPAGGDVPTTVTGGVTSYVVYTDAASLSKVSPTEAPQSVPAGDVLAMARDKGYGVTVVHDGEAQVFINLDPKEVVGLLGNQPSD